MVNLELVCYWFNHIIYIHIPTYLWWIWGWIVIGLTTLYIYTIPSGNLTRWSDKIFQFIDRSMIIPYYQWIGFVGKKYWFKPHDLHGKIYGFRLGFSRENQSMYGIYTNIGGMLMVNVTIYSIHGSYGLLFHISFWMTPRKSWALEKRWRWVGDPRAVLKMVGFYNF